MQTDLAGVTREEVNRVLQQFYAEMVKIDGRARISGGDDCYRCVQEEGWI